jgi:hypothetical protein
LTVRDVGDVVLSYQWQSHHFNPEVKVFDGVQANIRYESAGQQTHNAVLMDLGNMKFSQGSHTPESYVGNYRDAQNNTLKVERFKQTGLSNKIITGSCNICRKKNKCRVIPRLMRKALSPGCLRPPGN